MRKITALFLLLFMAIGFTGCYEMSEEYTISADNSAIYDVNMDLGQLLAMVASMGGEDALKNDPEFAQLKDTTIYFKSFTDTATKLSADQKAWMGKGRVTMKMKLEDKLFKMNIHLPFNSLEQLEKSMDPANQDGFAGLMSQVMDSKRNDPGENGDEKGEVTEEEEDVKKKSSENFNMLQSMYKTSFKNGVIERKVDEAKAAAAAEDETMAQMKQMASMMGEMKMSTVLRLPRPVKKTSGEGLEISADKRTVTVRYNLEKMIEDPKSGIFTIEY